MRLNIRPWEGASRYGGLRRFAGAITVFNLLGHTVFGFEQSWLQPLLALSVSYGVELALETTDAWAVGRPARYSGGLRALVDFLLPSHITGLAVAMLLYSGSDPAPIVFATAVAVASKYVLRAPVEGGGSRHYFNPSNLGITLTLLLFPWVGIAPPYHFTENLTGVGDWILPGLIVVSGTFINLRFTGRVPLLSAWLAAFAAQAAIRSAFFGTPLVAGLLPVTGLAFILYTFYMVTDPATTPTAPRQQVLFGAAVAATYGVLLLFHIVFGLFFALTIVCAGRGAWMYASALRRHSKLAPAPADAMPAAQGAP